MKSGMSGREIRSDVVGSLLRPPELRAARERWERGELSSSALKQVEDQAVDDAVTLQEAAGLDVVTDGELRRYAFFGHLIDALEGFDKFGGWAIPFRDQQGNELLFKRAVVVSRLKRRRHMCAEEFTYLRARTDRPAKATMISALNTASYYDPDPEAPGKTYMREGGFLSGLDRFDAEFFGVPPREAASLDPQQRLLLEVAWEALENAGIPASSLGGRRVGVVVGLGTQDFAQLMLRDGTGSTIDAYMGTGGAPCTAVGRIAYTLGLQGPAMAIDTAFTASG